MLNTEAGPTRTCRGGSRRSPAISQGKDIDKSTLMKTEAMFPDEEGLNSLSSGELGFGLMTSRIYCRDKIL